MGSAFLRMNSSTSIPSMVGGRLTRFCFPFMKIVLYSFFRRFFSAFSAAVSLRLRFAITNATPSSFVTRNVEPCAWGRSPKGVAPNRLTDTHLSMACRQRARMLRTSKGSSIRGKVGTPRGSKYALAASMCFFCPVKATYRGLS